MAVNLLERGALWLAGIHSTFTPLSLHFDSAYDAGLDRTVGLYKAIARLEGDLVQFWYTYEVCLTPSSVYVNRL